MHISKVVVYHISLIILNMRHNIKLRPRFRSIPIVILHSLEDLVFLRVVSETIGDPVFW